MDSKLYILAITSLIVGLVGGYLIGSTTLQNQLGTYELRIQSKDAELTAKDALIQAKDVQIQAQAAQIQAKDTQIQAQAAQIQVQDTLIQTQENMPQQLKANITKLQEQIESISVQFQTHVRIDSVTWGSAMFTLDVRNIGGVITDIESISIRVNQAGSTPTTFETPSVRVSIPTGLHTMITLNYQWATSTSYIVRVITTSGVYYEAVFTSPAV